MGDAQLIPLLMSAPSPNENVQRRNCCASIDWSDCQAVFKNAQLGSSKQEQQVYGLVPRKVGWFYLQGILLAPCHTGVKKKTATTLCIFHVHCQSSEFKLLRGSVTMNTTFWYIKQNGACITIWSFGIRLDVTAEQLVMVHWWWWDCGQQNAKKYQTNKSPTTILLRLSRASCCPQETAQQQFAALPIQAHMTWIMLQPEHEMYSWLEGLGYPRKLLHQVRKEFSFVPCRASLSGMKTPQPTKKLATAQQLHHPHQCHHVTSIVFLLGWRSKYHWPSMERLSILQSIYRWYVKKKTRQKLKKTKHCHKDIKKCFFGTADNVEHDPSQVDSRLQHDWLAFPKKSVHVTRMTNVIASLFDPQ